MIYSFWDTFSLFFISRSSSGGLRLLMESLVSACRLSEESATCSHLPAVSLWWVFGLRSKTWGKLVSGGDLDTQVMNSCIINLEKVLAPVLAWVCVCVCVS